MASASKTPNLNLPQWVGTEKPERTDFNAANSNIDTAIGSRTYTEQNYVTNGETVTASIDALDTNLNLVQSDIDSHEALKSPHGVAPVELWTGNHITNSASVVLSESFRNFHFVIVVFALSASDQAWVSNQLVSDLVTLSTPQVTYYGLNNILFNFASNTSIFITAGLSNSIRLRKVYGLLRK